MWRYTTSAPTTAQDLVDRHTTNGRLDTLALARELHTLATQQPSHVKKWLDDTLGLLSADERRGVADAFVREAGTTGVTTIAATRDGQLTLQSIYREASPDVQKGLQEQQGSLPMCPVVDFTGLHSAQVPATQPQPPADTSEKQRELILDLTQIGLSIAGIIDPTPISDGADGLVSLGRGDWLGASISVVSMIPYVGDLSKVGKLGKFLDAIKNAVDLAKNDPGFRRLAEPVLRQIKKAIDAAPLDSLPSAVREPLKGMTGKIDELLNGTAAKESPARTPTALAKSRPEIGSSARRSREVQSEVALAKSGPEIGSSGQPMDVASDFVHPSQIGTNPQAPDFYSVPDQNGGQVWVSKKPITQDDFASIVDNSKGPVNILSGTHGDVDGLLHPERSFFDEDLARWGNNPGTNVSDITTMSPNQISSAVNSPGDAICAWCYSERSVDTLQALGHVP